MALLKIFKEELKTLKDIFEKSKYKEIIERELKAEAIKWVKDLMKEKQRCVPIGEKEDNMGFWFIQDINAAWIKYFFNLTEEEWKQ